MSMDWNKLLNSKRIRRPDNRPPPEFPLDQFRADQDLILFSQPFRRLQSKTQVHPLSDNDHVRTRLTHSIEVGMIGYALGWGAGEEIIKKYNLKNVRREDFGNLVQAACLAHDIGNPPFGHAGEKAIREWFLINKNKFISIGLNDIELNDFIFFEGNAQGFRIITQLENFQENGGMWLTYATLGTFMKYPWGSKESENRGKPGKFSFFISEKEYAEEVARAVGLIEDKNGGWRRHPLAYLVEAADDICYAVADLEDGIEMGSFSFNEYERIFKKFIERSEIRKSDYESFGNNNETKITYMRSKAITDFSKQTIKIFMSLENEILNGEYDGNLLDRIQDKDTMIEAKERARDIVFKHEKKLYTEIAAYEIIGGLLNAYTGACLFNGGNNMSQKHRHLLDLMGPCAPKESVSIYKKLLRVTDYISGMTDRFATGMFRQIQGIATGTMTPAPLRK